MKIQLFNHKKFGEIRATQLNGVPYLVGKDVAEKLGYVNVSDAIKRHIDEEDKCKIDEIVIHDSIGRGQKPILINESGLYSLILSSNLPTAKEFKRWVTSEVLPSIRKHGAYMTDDTLEQALTSPDFLIQLATKLKEEQEARLLAEREAKEKQMLIDAQAPKIEALKEISECSVGDVDMGECAKLIGIGRNLLYEVLRDRGILDRKNVPYQAYINQKYFKYNAYPYNGRICKSVKVTPKGITWIAEGLKKCGYC